MKTFKTAIAILGLAFISINISAQAPINAAQLAKEQTEMVKKNVDKVTPDQQNKILPIEQEFANNMQSARNKSKADTAEMNKRTFKLCKSRDAKIKTVLTASQYSQYLDMEKGWSCKLNCTK
jgi:hypothetical protein